MNTGKPKRTIDLLAEVTAQLILARDQYDTLKKCGLDKEAAVVQQRINALVVEQKELDMRNQREQADTKFLMYICFAACDMLSECADDFANAIDRTSWGELKRNDDGFTRLLRQQAKEFNDIVVMIDKGGKGEKSSMLYADIAEEATAAAKQAVTEVFKRHFSDTKTERML